MISFKAPIYKIYFYLVIIFLTTTVLASSGVMSFVDFSTHSETASVGWENSSSSDQKNITAFLVPPYSDDSTEHVAFSSTCFAPGTGDSTQFYAVTDESEYVRFSWNFGTGEVADTSNQRNPYFFYQTPGDYNITATFFKANGDFIVIDTVVTISGDIAPPNLLPDTAICPEQFPFEIRAYVNGQNPAGAKYIWSNGDTNSVISAATPGNYWVAVTVGSCTKVEEIEVTEYGKPRQRAAVWHFGQGAGIDFSEGGPVAIDSAKSLNAPGGSATISDINGKLLFYTNGSTIFNKDHEVMKGGKDIGGDSNSTQSSIIMPWPTRVPYYFVFTTEDDGSSKKTLSVSLIDMKGDSAKGTVVYKDNYVYEPVSEKLTAYALKNSQGVDSLYWVVTQDANTGDFVVFKVDSSGIGQPPQTFGFGTPAVTEGQMKISSTGDYIAVAAGNEVHLYNFNDTTGAITDSVTIELDGGGAYGVEFSPDGNKLYVSNSSGIYQIDVADSTGTRMPNDSILLPKHKYLIASGSNFGSLQIGPDGRIYVAVDGANALAVIANPTREDDEVGFLQTGFPLSPNTTSTKGLSNFVQNFIEPPQGPGIGHQDACGPGAISFFASGWGDRDDFSWSVTNASGASVFSQSGRMLTMIEPTLQLGTYFATVRITNDCKMDTTLFDTVRVIGGPAPIELGGPYVLCPGGSQQLDAGAIQADEQYLWSTGETTRTITINQPGVYSVIVLKSNGCTEVDQAIVNPPTFGDIIGDTVLCQGQVSRLTTSSPGLAHRWFWGNPLIERSNARYIDVNSSGTYVVQVTDANGCTDSDTVTVTVSPKPLVNPTVAVSPTCNSTNGRIVLTASTDADYPDYTYQWLNQNNQAIPGANTETLTNVGPGIYRAIVTHPQGCDSIYTVTINPNNIGVAATPSATVCVAGAAAENVVTINVNPYPNPFPVAQNFLLEVFDQNTNLSTGVTQSFNTQSTTVTLSEGTYYARITDPNNGNCVYTVSNIIVEPSVNRPNVLDLGPPQFTCSSSQSITATPLTSPNLYTYSWAAFNSNYQPIAGAIGAGANTPSITATRPSGSNIVNYILTIRNADCQKKDTVQVTFVDFSFSLPAEETRCDDAGSYTIVPTFPPDVTQAMARNFAYRWTRTGDGSFSANSSTLTVNQSGEYNLTVTDNRTGCSFGPVSQQVNINQGPTDQLGPDITSGCEGDVITLNAGNSGLGPVNYSWSRNGVPLGANAQVIQVTQSGQYVVDINLNGCTRSFDIIVNFHQLPVPVILGDTIFCPSRTPSVRLTGGTPTIGGPSFQWLDSINGAVISEDFEVTITKGGTYYLVMTTPQGCSVRKTVHITEECESRIRTGDAFSPNGDGKNDVFHFKGDDIRVFDVTIFNRWGQLIYQSTTQLDGWDGRTNNGKIAPAGTYVYVVRYKSAKGDTDKLLTQKGRIVLVK